jgi:hypothetical protein
MSSRRVKLLVALSAALVSVGATSAVRAQAEATSDLDIPLSQYMAKAGQDVKLIEPGKLKIDGHTMVCGKRPTVIDPKFESWGGAYPGYLILNPERMKDLPTPVKLFVYAHECGHQFIGRNEGAADCFGVKRGRRYGWLAEEGLAQVCDFISGLKGDADHAAGPKRCNKMRMCYMDAGPRAARNKK